MKANSPLSRSRRSRSSLVMASYLPVVSDSASSSSKPLLFARAWVSPTMLHEATNMPPMVANIFLNERTACGELRWSAVDFDCGNPQRAMRTNSHLTDFRPRSRASDGEKTRPANCSSGYAEIESQFQFRPSNERGKEKANDPRHGSKKQFGPRGFS